MDDLGLFLGGGRACLLDRDQMVRFSRDGSSRGGWSDGFRLLGEEKTCFAGSMVERCGCGGGWL